jgi:hypothetical protein
MELDGEITCYEDEADLHEGRGIYFPTLLSYFT